MEMETAQACGVGQFTQRRQILGRFDLTAGSCHRGGMLGGEVSLILCSAFAGALTRGLGLLSRLEKFDVLRFRQARQAAGAAIDTSGFHRVDKLPVSRRVASYNGGPAWVVFGGDLVRRGGHGFMSVDGFQTD